jgi:trimethylamine:corrinoid methyltransferase-like protein
METRAARQVDDILASHQPEPLPGDVQRDIRKIVERELERTDSR